MYRHVVNYENERIFFFCRQLHSYQDVRAKVLEVFNSSIEFLDTEDFNTYIKNDGFEMSKAKEILTAGKEDLMADCVVVIAGKLIVLNNFYHKYYIEQFNLKESM